MLPQNNYGVTKRRGCGGIRSRIWYEKPPMSKCSLMEGGIDASAISAKPDIALKLGLSSHMYTCFGLWCNARVSLFILTKIRSTRLIPFLIYPSPLESTENLADELAVGPILLMSLPRTTPARQKSSFECRNWMLISSQWRAQVKS